MYAGATYSSSLYLNVSTVLLHTLSREECTDTNSGRIGYEYEARIPADYHPSPSGVRAESCQASTFVCYDRLVPVQTMKEIRGGIIDVPARRQDPMQPRTKATFDRGYTCTGWPPESGREPRRRPLARPPASATSEMKSVASAGDGELCGTARIR